MRFENAMYRQTTFRPNCMRRFGTFEQLESRKLMVANWQNPALACDVDNSGIVAPIDALIVINTINLIGTRPLSGSATNQSSPYYDVNGDDSVSLLDVLVVINAINRAMPVLSISSSLLNSQDLDNNGVVSGESVDLRGETGPNSMLASRVQLGDGNVLNTTSRADSAGLFNTSIPLSSGVNRVNISAVDELGATTEVTGQLRRGSLVTEWNATLLNELRKLSKATATAWTPPQAVQTKPPGIARNLAMIYGAMFDAVNAIDGAYEPFMVSLPRQTGANPLAAATAAARRVATSLYSDQENILAWDATYNETLNSLPDNDARRQGIELGNSVADSVLANRLNDGSSVTKHLQYGTSPGEWHPTAPVFEAVLPQWPAVTPFVSPTSIFQVEPPPTLNSTAYAQAVDEVMRLGGTSSTLRTEDQTAIARFWADGSGTASPPGHWNQITSDILATKQMSLIEQIRAMALINFAMADAGIASWKTKYDYELWRPVDAIQNADVDSNSATSPDRNWTPLIVTPPFPSYVSGHSTFSSAASAVLTRLFGPSANFTSQSDTASGWLPVSTEASPKERTFSSFAQAADEAGLSRIYGGIHFNFDNTQGQKLGTDIGTYVSDNALKKR